MSKETTCYSIGQLAELTGVSRRTIRFYVQEQLLSPPHGLGRSASYDDSHLERLQLITRFRQAGLSLEVIRQRLTQPGRPEPTIPHLPPTSLWVRVLLAPGLELHAQPAHFKLTPDRLARLQQACRNILGEDSPSDVPDSPQEDPS